MIANWFAVLGELIFTSTVSVHIVQVVRVIVYVVAIVAVAAVGVTSVVLRSPL